MNAQSGKIVVETTKLQHRSHKAIKMHSPSPSQDDSNVIDSTKSEKLADAQDASASATPVKRVSFPEAVNSAGIKKAVTKRGTRQQNFRNSRVCDSAWLAGNPLMLNHSILMRSLKQF
jgi:hypothetical protein